MNNINQTTLEGTKVSRPALDVFGEEFGWDYDFISIDTEGDSVELLKALLLSRCKRIRRIEPDRRFCAARCLERKKTNLGRLGDFYIVIVEAIRSELCKFLRRKASATLAIV